MFACSFCSVCRKSASVFGSTLPSLLLASGVLPALPLGTAAWKLEILEGGGLCLCCCGVPTTDIVPVTSPIPSFVKTFLGFGLDARPDVLPPCAAGACS